MLSYLSMRVVQRFTLILTEKKEWKKFYALLLYSQDI